MVHPGIVGDRGPSALDWAIMRDCAEWGVTVLQANGEMDGGDIWAAETFPMRLAKKSSLYRNEVIEAAVRAVLAAVERFQSKGFSSRSRWIIPAPKCLAGCMRRSNRPTAPSTGSATTRARC